MAFRNWRASSRGWQWEWVQVVGVMQQVSARGESETTNIILCF